MKIRSFFVVTILSVLSVSAFAKPMKCSLKTDSYGYNPIEINVVGKTLAMSWKVDQYSYTDRGALAGTSKAADGADQYVFKGFHTVQDCANSATIFIDKAIAAGQPGRMIIYTVGNEDCGGGRLLYVCH